MNKLGRWLKEKRLNSACSQKEYAKGIGITDVTLSKIENGEHCGTKTLRKLNRYTGASTKVLRGMMLFEEEGKV